MLHAAALLPSLTLALAPSVAPVAGEASPPSPLAGPLAGPVPSPAPPTGKIRLAKPERLLVDGVPIDLAKFSGHAGPALYDRLQSGKPDLIVGSLTGDIQLYMNNGTVEEPLYRVAMKMRLKSPNSLPLKFHSW